MFSLVLYLVKVTDDFVEESEAFQTLLVDVVLVVELPVVGDGGEHDPDVLVPLVVQLLKIKSLQNSNCQSLCLS